MGVFPESPSVWLAGGMVVGGLIMLIAGGEMLVIGAVRLARRLGMSPLLIGLTIVAFGTSLPELFVSLAASFSGYPDIMIGNVIGSNIANIGLILGLSAVIYPIRVKYGKIIIELYMVIVASFLVFIIGGLGFFYRIFGLFFVATLVFYTVVAYQRASRNKVQNFASETQHNYAYSKILFFCGAGLLIMAAGSDIFIDGAVAIARFFGVAELVIGLTLAAVGTSLPELATSFSAIRRRQSDILVGNVVGSNLFNLLMVMGGTALITPFAISKQVLWRDLPVMIIYAVLLIPLLRNRHRLLRWQGLLMVTAYGIYIGTLGW